MASIRNIIFITTAILFLGQVFLYWDYAIDDAFITFTYAENLADGHGPVFNVGDKPVEAYSNTLWMLMLATTYLVGLPTVLTAKILGVVFFAIAGWLWFWNFHRDKSGYAWLVGPLFLICPLSPFWAVSGLELGLHAFAVSAAIIMLWRRSGWGCLFLALIVWGRPEGFITATVMILAAMATGISGKEFRFKNYIYHILAIALAVASITIMRLAFFGLPLPNTFYVKTEEVGFHFRAVSDMAIRFIPVFSLMILAIYMAIKNKMWEKLLVISLAVFMAQFFVSTMINPVMNYLFRYLVPFMPLAIFAAVYSIKQFKRPIFRQLVVVILIISLISPVGKIFAHLGVEREIVSAQDKAIRWAGSQPDETIISLTDIGRIPYYARRHYIDIWGLASDNIGRQGFNPVTEYLKFPDYFLLVGHVRQDGKIALRFGRERLIAQNRGFGEVYRLIGALSPEGVPVDSVGYHYLILKKNQGAMDSLLQLYPIK